MRFSAQPREQKFIKGYKFLLFAKIFVDKYGKKLMRTTKKTVKNVGMNAAKTQFNRVVQKTTEEMFDLIGNKIADKVTSVGKPKNKGKEEDNKTYETQEIYISPEKRHQICYDLKLS